MADEGRFGSTGADDVKILPNGGWSRAPSRDTSGPQRTTQLFCCGGASFFPIATKSGPHEDPREKALPRDLRSGKGQKGVGNAPKHRMAADR